MTTQHFSDEIVTAHNSMKTQQAMTSEAWHDDVARRFYEQHLDYYDQAIETFLEGYGQLTIQGRGFNDLCTFVDQKLHEIQQL